MFLKDFICVDQKYIPHTNNRYLVSINGVIKDTKDNKELVQCAEVDEEKHFFIEDLLGNQHLLKHSVIMAIVFKCCNLEPHLWDMLDVFYIDDDVNNTHPGNLVWKYPIDGIPYHGLDGFRYIPGYSNYAINKVGFVFSIIDGRMTLPVHKEDTYRTARVVADIKNNTEKGLLHRMLALAFHQYPANVDKLDVNHKDGIKHNYDLDNLEWATRKQNCDHAYANGLRNDNIPIQIKNIFTGEVFEFYSDDDCNKHFGFKLGASRYRSKTKGQKIYDYGILIREKNCSLDWREFKDPVKAYINEVRPIPYKLTSATTGESITCKASEKACAILKLADSSFRHFFKKAAGKVPVNGYYIEYADFENLNRSFFDEIRKKKASLIAGNSR